MWQLTQAMPQDYYSRISLYQQSNQDILQTTMIHFDVLYFSPVITLTITAVSMGQDGTAGTIVSNDCIGVVEHIY